MVDGVYGNIMSFGLFVVFDSEFVFGMRSFEEGFVGFVIIGNDIDYVVSVGVDDFFGVGGEFDVGFVFIGVVVDNGDVVVGGVVECIMVIDFFFDVGDDGIFGDGSEGEDVVDGKSGVFVGVDELVGVYVFVGNEGFGDFFEFVGWVELNVGEGSIMVRVVDDFFYDIVNVVMMFGEIERFEFGGGFV